MRRGGRVHLRADSRSQAARGHLPHATPAVPSHHRCPRQCHHWWTGHARHPPVWSSEKSSSTHAGPRVTTPHPGARPSTWRWPLHARTFPCTCSVVERCHRQPLCAGTHRGRRRPGWWALRSPHIGRPGVDRCSGPARLCALPDGIADLDTSTEALIEATPTHCLPTPARSRSPPKPHRPSLMQGYESRAACDRRHRARPPVTSRPTSARSSAPGLCATS